MGQVPLKPRNIIGFLVGAFSAIGTVVFLLVYPPIRHRFDSAEYPTFAGMMLLFVAAIVAAAGVKLFGNIEVFQQTALARFFARPRFMFCVVPLLATATALASHSWVLFMAILTIGGVLHSVGTRNSSQKS